jgi:hypothetical protein
VVRNRRRLAGALGLAVPFVGVHQVHGTEVWWANGATAGAATSAARLVRPRADVLVTRDRSRALLMTVADCPAVIVAARREPAVALVHAGWRGTVAGIIERTLHELRVRAGLDPATLEAWVAPAIGACCYEVGPELVERLERRDRAFLVSRRLARPHLDLVGLVLDRLQRAGLPGSRLTASTTCTCCQHERYFSYRADRGRTGRNGVVAWIP